MKSKKSHIIILNGTSSVGKTSIARELQKILDSKYLYLSIDHFIDMLNPNIVALDVNNENFLTSTEGLYCS